MRNKQTVHNLQPKHKQLTVPYSNHKKHLIIYPTLHLPHPASTPACIYPTLHLPHPASTPACIYPSLHLAHPASTPPVQQPFIYPMRKTQKLLLFQTKQQTSAQNLQFLEGDKMSKVILFKRTALGAANKVLNK